MDRSSVCPAVLLIGWGNYLFLIRLELVDDKFHFIEASNAYFSNEIIFCGFISNSIVIVFTEKNVSIVHTHDFQLGIEPIEPF